MNAMNDFLTMLMKSSPIQSDCLSILPSMQEDSIDSVVTDPPYELGFMGKKWDSTGIAFQQELWGEILRVLKPGGYLLAFGGTRTHHRMMVAIEDAGFQIRDVLMWVYAQGFPKGHDIAWEIHKKASMECGIMVEYDQDTQQAERDVQEAEHSMRFVRASYLSTPVYACAECGQVLQPFVSKQETQSLRAAWSQSQVIWPEQSSMEGRGDLEESKGELQRCQVCSLSSGLLADGAEGWLHNGASARDGSIPWQIANSDGSRPSYRPQSSQQLHRQSEALRIERRAQEVRGLNVALKPAYEPIILAMKPIEGTFAENVLKWGVGGLNIDGNRIAYAVADDSRIGKGYGHLAKAGLEIGEKKANKEGEYQNLHKPEGRWPANLLLDDSEEVTEMFPDVGVSRGGASFVGTRGGNVYQSEQGGTVPIDPGYGDSGSAARFFYKSKTSPKERNLGCEALYWKRTDTGHVSISQEAYDALPDKERAKGNIHPTVKPIDLLRYLIKLITPPGGIVLDPFLGSGSAQIAANLESFQCVGIERDPVSVQIAKARCEAREASLEE